MAQRVYPWRIELNDGQWAQFRDPKQVTRATRRAYRLARMAIPAEFFAAVAADPDTPLTAEWQDALWAAQDAATMMVLADWSFDMPISMASLGALADDDTFLCDSSLVARAATAVINDQEFVRDPNAEVVASEPVDATAFAAEPTADAREDVASPTDPSLVPGSTGEDGTPSSDPTTSTE
jgi:hypothetical protein